jgi:hypothetical protein
MGDCIERKDGSERSTDTSLQPFETLTDLRLFLLQVGDVGICHTEDDRFPDRAEERNSDRDTEINNEKCPRPGGVRINGGRGYCRDKGG